MQLLKPVLNRVGNHLRFHKQLLQHMIDGIDSENILEMLIQILSRFVSILKFFIMSLQSIFVAVSQALPGVPH